THISTAAPSRQSPSAVLGALEPLLHAFTFTASSASSLVGAAWRRTPVALCPVGLVPGLGANNQQYAVSRDGRFLINQRVETSTTAAITLLLNWKPKP